MAKLSAFHLLCPATQPAGQSYWLIDIKEITGQACNLLFSHSDVFTWQHPTSDTHMLSFPPTHHQLQTPHRPHLQALQYLRKLCSHPLLVLDPAIPAHVLAVEKATQAKAASPAAWKAVQPSLHMLQHAPKLLALQQLLQVCLLPLPPTPAHVSTCLRKCLVLFSKAGMLHPCSSASHCCYSMMQPCP